jgi:hypothetical protein
MKGTASPKWTAGREAWLAKLAEAPAKPCGVGEGSTATYCRALGWTTQAGAYLPPRLRRDTITDTGREVLAAWRAGDRTAAKHLDVKPPRATPFHIRIGYALKGDGLPALADWLVFTGQAQDFTQALAAGLERAAAATRSQAAALEQATVAAGAFAAEFEPDEPVEDLSQDEPPVPAPSFGRPSLGVAVASIFVQCGRCHGRGVTGHNWTCASCNGTGKVKRTAAL